MISPLAIRRFTRSRLASCALLAFAFVVLCGPAARPQQRNQLDPNETYRRLAVERMRQTQRAIEEIQRRRFEEHKDQPQSTAEAARANAKPAVVRAVSPEEQQALAHTERGLDYFAKNKYEQAIKEYNEAIRICPNLTLAYNNLGSAYFALTRYNEAAAFYRRAVQLDPKYGQAHFNLGLTYLKLGQEQAANDALVAAAKAYLITGDEQLKAGQLKEAEEAFKGLLQIDPNYPLAHLRLGAVYNAAGRYTEAVVAFAQVIRLQPENAEAHADLGESYYRQRRYDEALAACQRANQLQPQAPAAYYIAGLAYVALGQRASALAQQEKLKSLNAVVYVNQLAAAIEQKTPRKP